jgi:hypothetical protein
MKSSSPTRCRVGRRPEVLDVFFVTHHALLAPWILCSYPLHAERIGYPKPTTLTTGVFNKSPFHLPSPLLI